MGTPPLKAGWLIPPRQPPWAKQALNQLVKRAPRGNELIWFTSSGTESVNQVKCIGLEPAAILASARAVNRHLRVSGKDRWLLTLPEYHVGGYMIRVRAILSDSKVFVLSKWDAHAFRARVVENKICLASLVPTQVHDLVAAKLKAPRTLRAIVVGGGAFSPGLYAEARRLGWPVLPSYGLTESASMVATAPLSSLRRASYPALEILDHARVKVKAGVIWVRGDSVTKSIAIADGKSCTFLDPRQNGWLKTSDLGQLSGVRLKVIGRRGEVVKVLGTLVSLAQLESDVEPFLGKCVVLAQPDVRAGSRLVAVTESKASLKLLAAAFGRYNEKVKGPHRLFSFCCVKSLPRTPLGKIKKTILAVQLGLRS